jgi:uncharacterized protein YcbK (DUF882 family)
MKSTYRCIALSAAISACLLTSPASPASPGADLPDDVLASKTRAAQPRERHLRLYHAHTGDRIDVVYRRGDAYVAEGLRALEDYLKDFRTGDARSFDPRLFDVLADLAESAGMPDGEFHVISAYRSPKTNEMLRGRTTGVAKNSLHMQALALDVRLPGVATSKLRDAALALGRGGVGYYAGSDFIHVDLGRVRRW